MRDEWLPLECKCKYKCRIMGTGSTVLDGRLRVGGGWMLEHGGLGLWCIEWIGGFNGWWLTLLWPTNNPTRKGRHIRIFCGGKYEINCYNSHTFFNRNDGVDGVLLVILVDSFDTIHGICTSFSRDCCNPCPCHLRCPWSLFGHHSSPPALLLSGHPWSPSSTPSNWSVVKGCCSVLVSWAIEINHLIF